MVKAIAHAKVKGDKVDARKLADLLRAGMIPESYVPKKDFREVRDLVRRRHYHLKLRTMLKNKIHAELATRCYKHVAERRGEKVTIVAAARKLTRAMYIMLKEDEAFRLDG